MERPGMTHESLVVTGEAALGRGAWDAGITLAAGYPGSPATHVLSTVMQLAQEQPPIAQQVEQAAQELARAARNEARLDNQPAAELIDQIAQDTEQAAQQAAELGEQFGEDTVIAVNYNQEKK